MRWGYYDRIHPIVIYIEMKFTFRTFFCGPGDCLFLVLKNGEDEMFIMVDCGQYTNEIDNFVRNELKNKIDYLIVTPVSYTHLTLPTKA